MYVCIPVYGVSLELRCERPWQVKSQDAPMSLKQDYMAVYCMQIESGVSRGKEPLDVAAPVTNVAAMTTTPPRTYISGLRSSSALGEVRVCSGCMAKRVRRFGIV